MTQSPLISPESLRERLAEDDAIALIDCQASLADPAQGRRDWLAAHLPGAVHLDLESDLSGPITPDTGRHPLPAPGGLEMSLSLAGIRPEQTVVVYDGNNSAFAVRCWWLLRWLGHEDVRVLDGGLAVWQAAGGRLESGEVCPDATTYRGQRGAMPVLDTAGVETSLNDAHVLLLDARGEARFRGEEEPIDPVAGHVPGARNHPFLANLDDQGRWRASETLRQRYRQLIADHDPTEVVHMCGSGVTACHNLFAMELAGLNGSALYAGSWSEWIRDPSRPIATGSE